VFLSQDYYNKLEAIIQETVGTNLENFPDSRCVLHCIREEIEGVKAGCLALMSQVVELFKTAVKFMIRQHFSRFIDL